MMNELTEEQQAVVDDPSLNVAVNATAGSGKTHTLIERAKQWQSDRPFHIAAFNVEAGNELKKRLGTRGARKRNSAGTLHSLAWYCATMRGEDLVMISYNSEKPEERNGYKEAREFVDDQARDWYYHREGYYPTGDVLKEVKEDLLGACNQVIQLRLEVRDLGAGHKTTDVLTKILETFRSKRWTSFDMLDLTFEFGLKQLEKYRSPPRILDGVVELMVDEAQDLTPLQWSLIDKLVEVGNYSLVIVGDDDQCIYEWRWANLNTFIQRCTDEATSLQKLTYNWRCPSNVVAAAATLIRKNTVRVDKEIKPAHLDGVPVRPSSDIILKSCLDPKQEASWLVDYIKTEAGPEGEEDWGRFGILTRTNTARGMIELMLFKALIPFKVLGTNVFQRWQVSRICDFFKSLLDSDEEAFINAAGAVRGIGRIRARQAAQRDDWWAELPRVARNRRKADEFCEIAEGVLMGDEDDLGTIIQELIEVYEFEESSLEKKSEEGDTAAEALKILVTMADLLDGVGVLEKARSLVTYVDKISASTSRYDNKKNQNLVILSTVHKLKGGEFPVTLIASADADMFPHKNAQSLPAIEAERRLFYVAMTRPKEQLVVSYSGMPSPFLFEAGILGGGL